MYVQEIYKKTQFAIMRESEVSLFSHLRGFICFSVLQTFVFEVNYKETRKTAEYNAGNDPPKRVETIIICQYAKLMHD